MIEVKEFESKFFLIQIDVDRVFEFKTKMSISLFINKNFSFWYFRNFHERYNIVDEFGNEYSVYYIKGISKKDTNTKTYYYYCGFKQSNCRYYRSIKTISERRELNNPDLIENKGLVRGKRNHLPNNWDDFSRVRDRSWKNFRKNQYK